MSDSVERLQQEVEFQLSQFDFPNRPASLYDPVRYMLSLGGKRMRPILVLLANDLFAGKNEHAMPAALGVEVFHNFTLLHDDIMDKAPLRRGKATVHEKWNGNIAILSGDAMFVKSCQLITQVPAAAVPNVMNLFLKTALEVCEGQQLDMDFESRDTVDVDEYIEMIKLKTAVLVGACLGIGAQIACASEEDVNHVYDFGVNLGIAFQLQDDILDVYGDEQKFGKQVGGDIIANKKTFLLLSALKNASGETADKLQHWLNYQGNDNLSKVNAIKEIYASLKVKEAAETKMNDLYAEALSHLDALPIDQNRTTALRKLSSMLMLRES
jgi:geranylgeranyl diphosphate synthase, type II